MLFLPIVYFPIFVLISKIKHGINIFFTNWNWKISHHQLKISFSEELFLDFVFFGTKILWIWISSTNNLLKNSMRDINQNSSVQQ